MQQIAMRNPLISIIMPAYNSERFIEASIQSVLNQTYKEWELLVLDDCSEDGTVELVQRYEAEYPGKIRLIHNPGNIEVAASRNRGVQKANGNLIAFLDSDDLWKPEKLARQMELYHKLKSSNIQEPLLFTGSAFLTEKGEPLDYTLAVPERIGYRELLKQNRISCSSVMAEKALLLKYPMPEGRLIHEDFAAWLKILKPKKGEVQHYAYAVQDPLLLYRVSEGSKSGNKIKAAKMNWRTYRLVGLNPVISFYYMGQYAARSILKWRHLK